MSKCPSPEGWRQFLATETSDPADEVLLAHLEGCAACQELLEALTAATRSGADREELTTPERSRPEKQAALDAAASSRARYTLTRLHAKGGIGQVWLARDDDLGREVALKELKPERADQPAVWARFVEEAKITGQLEHPGIVPVHELTRNPGDGKPFYTMRFIRGQTLCDAGRAYHKRRAAGQAGPLELRQLLGAFVAVCNAVAYAHSRGVIHRDLKGQNIILGKYGEVVVLDWGLAKVLGPPGAAAPAASLLPVALAKEDSRDETQHGQVLGTPAYMAPEQADGRLEQIGPLTDVYGLGAILYEVLTGQPPFTGTDTHDVLYRVVHEAPPRPRERVPALPRPLEAICLKALAKQPAARYASATALADDVQHYLADEPVSAYAEPALLRLARWGRRHRPLAAAAAVLLVAAVVALTGGTLLLERANRRTQEQRKLAEESFRQARQAVDEYFTTISENTLLKSPQPGLQPLRKELLEAALKYYEAFLNQRGEDPSLQDALAQAYLRVGILRFEIGTKPEALAALRRACELYAALAQAAPDDPAFRAELAKGYRFSGRVQCEMRSWEEARASTRRAIELGEQLARDYPAVAEYRKELAWGYNNQGRIGNFTGQPLEALTSYRQAARVSEQLARDNPANAEIQRSLGASYGNIAIILGDLGHIPQAVEANEQALAVFAALTRVHPDNYQYQADLGQICNNIGFLSLTLQDAAKAKANLERARGIYAFLVRANPAVTAFKQQQALTYGNLGLLHLYEGKFGNSLECNQQALQLIEQLAAGDPAASTMIRRDEADCHRGIGSALRQLGKPTEALAHLRKAIDIGLHTPEKHPWLLYGLACAQAQCSAVLGQVPSSLAGSEKAEQHRLAAQSVETLRQATDAGYRNLTWIEQDPDLEPVRGRADFQQILRELKVKARELTGQTAPEQATDRLR
jgi:serine/threonine-protein kinase